MDRLALVMLAVVRTHPCPGLFITRQRLQGRGHLEPRLMPQPRNAPVGHNSRPLIAPAGLLVVAIEDVKSEGGVPVDVGIPFGTRIQEKLLDGSRQVKARKPGVLLGLQVVGNWEFVWGWGFNRRRDLGPRSRLTVRP